jgi:CheY-like chemotaxis protein
VVEANGGPNGLQIAESRHPSAIFLDLIMDGMQGEETLDRLKANPVTASIPVIIHTSKTLSDGERQKLLRNAVAIVSKQTSSREESLTAIHNALAKAGLDLEISRREA